MIKGKNLINNNWSAIGNSTFHTFNPETNTENQWKFTEPTEQEINLANEAAEEAFRTYRKLSEGERADFLDEIARQMEGMRELIIETYQKESGLPEARANGEFDRTLFQLRSYGDHVRQGLWREKSIDEAIPDRKPNPKPDIRKTYIPIGPVVVFGASNFPLAYSTAGGDVASALAAGCPVIVKSHPLHAGTGDLVSQAVQKAIESKDMPAGVFANLNIRQNALAEKLIQHPSVKGIGFTGSREGGRAIYDVANKRETPIPVFAEMGSINPVIISNLATIKKPDEWAALYAENIMKGTGQYCTNPGLIMGLDSPELDNFSAKLAIKLSEHKSTVMLSPSMHKRYKEMKEDMLTIPAVKELSTVRNVPVNYAEQTVVSTTGKDFLEDSKLHREVFGPFSMIVKCENNEELLRVIRQLEGQLTGTIIAEPEEFDALAEIIDELQQKVGRLIFNGVPMGVEVCKSQHHGGPYPASTDARFGAVGPDAIKRWIRPLAYQNFPLELLPEELKF